MNNELTNKCPSCGAIIEINENSQKSFCEFCGFALIKNQQAPQTQQVVQIVKTQNHEWQSKLALAQNWERTYFAQGAKAVVIGTDKGFNAVVELYCQSELVGGHEPEQWLSFARFYTKGLVFGIEQKELVLHSINRAIVNYTLYMDNAIRFSETGKDELEREKTETIEKLRADLSRFPEKKPNGSAAASAKGCYIATSVYGSYDCPEVWTLRRYRDFKLSNTKRGRLFTKIYYKISPTIVKLFGKTKLFNRISKWYLDKKVRKLQKRGFASTPYED